MPRWICCGSKPGFRQMRASSQREDTGVASCFRIPMSMCFCCFPTIQTQTLTQI